MKMFYKIQIYYYHDKLHLKHVQNNTQKHSPGQQRFAAINGAGKKKKIHTHILRVRTMKNRLFL